VWFEGIAPVDPAPFLATIEALPVPSTWEVVHTQTQRDYLLGSRVDRYYFVDGEPQEVAPVVQQVLRSSGLEIFFPDYDTDRCDTPSPGARPAASCPVTRSGTCQEIASAGPVSCHIVAFRWLSQEPPLLERLFVYVSPRGGSVDIGVGKEHRLVDTANRVLVRISADRTTASSFWSSPTPRAS